MKRYDRMKGEAERATRLLKKVAEREKEREKERL